MRTSRLCSIRTSNGAAKPCPARQFRPSYRRLLHQERLTLSEQIRAFPFPPLESGNTRARLAQWQKESGSTFTDPIGVRAEAQKLQALTGRKDDEAAEDKADDTVFLENEEEVGEVAAIQLREFIIPGSLVEITPKYSVSDPVFAISLAQQNDLLVLLTISGRIASVKQKHLEWHQPRWINPSELISLDPYLPSDDVLEEAAEDIKVHDFGVPRELSAPFITRMNEFRNEVHSTYRKHATILDQAHDILADKVELQFGTLTRIAQKLLGDHEKQITPEILYTVRKALLRSPIGFNAVSMTQRKTQLWQVRPKSMIRDADMARKWIREYRSALSVDVSRDPRSAAAWQNSEGYKTINAFIKRCRQLIDESRKTRPRTQHGLGAHISKTPCDVKSFKGKEFSASDRLLIRFIECWSIQKAFEHDQALTALPSFLLKSIERYPDLLPGHHTGVLLLQELGCLPPYANLYYLSPELMLPDRGLSVRLDQIYNTVLQTPPSAIATDSMEKLRHDWGDLPVYCIDDADTADVDDGVSIEPLQGDPSKHWIRVHVANPSAFVEPNSSIGALARQLCATLYAPDHTTAMLPPVFRDLFSLKSGSPTLTISFLMDKSGVVLDTDIRPARIHNVFHATYDDLSDMLGHSWKARELREPLVVGATRAQVAHTFARRYRPSDLKPLHESHKSSLATLTDLMLQARKRREDNSLVGFTLSLEAASVRLYKSAEDVQARRWPELPTRFQSQESLRYTGDPIICVQGQPVVPSSYTPLKIDARDAKHMIAEVMIQAGVTAAKWSWDRKIPLPYRTQMLKSAEGEIQRFSDELTNSGVASKALGQTTWADALLFQQCRLHFLPAFSMSRPAKHTALGVSHYVKATSPLRRYADILAHWQIEAALRYEAESGQSLITNNLSRPLPTEIPFNAEQVESLIWRMVDREKLLNATSRRSTEHWQTLLYHRAMYDPGSNQSKIPELTPGTPFNAVVTLTHISRTPFGDSVIQATTQNHNIRVSMIYDPQLHANGISLLDVWECVLDRVEVDRSYIIVKPIRLVERVDEAALRAYDAAKTRLQKVKPSLPELV